MVPYYIFGNNGWINSMILNWEQKITTTCKQLGINPETFADEPDLQEWMAKHFGFESYNTFFALASPKDIVAGMALPMLPDHRNYEYHLVQDCIELIEHNYLLYADVERTEQEIECFLMFTNENFGVEIKAATLNFMKITFDEAIMTIVNRSDIYKTLLKQLNILTRL